MNFEIKSNQMGYTLQPRNKKVEALDFGIFSWPILLEETGIGYIIGYGKGRRPATNVYQGGNNGSPVTNDGYKVSAFEAKAMGMMARGYLSVKRFVNKEWETLDERDKAFCKTQTVSDGKLLYVQEVGEGILEKLEKFAEFAEKSQGFSIH